MGVSPRGCFGGRAPERPKPSPGADVAQLLGAYSQLSSPVWSELRYPQREGLHARKSVGDLRSDSGPLLLLEYPSVMP